ncbi:MAG: DNA polymerase III subunit delta' [Deltaproteobacteria bacterium]|nr:DNA polymerase III subunit delta' [Deltaproteobacteria bacterium]
MMESASDVTKSLEYLAVQKIALDQLASMLRSDRIPNALMFLGADGLGQDLAALLLGMAANCGNPGSGVEGGPFYLFGPQSPCGACPGCRKILSGNHPDFLSVRRDGAFVKKGAVKELLSNLSMRMGEGRHRFAVVHDAAFMNRESANTLLKSLEEPPPKTTFILIAAQTADLLPTLVSRCRPVRFLPVSTQTARKWLTEKLGADEEAALSCALLCGSGLARAVNLYETGQWMRYKFLSGLLDGMEEGGRMEALLLAEVLARPGREKLTEDLSVIRAILREKLVAAPDAALRRKFAARLNHLETCEKDIRGNVAARLALDGFFTVFGKSGALEGS